MKISVVLPVYNEEEALTESVERLGRFLSETIEDSWGILIVDNGSTDSTLERIKELSRKYPYVEYIHMDKKGRGRALKKAWSESDADILSYMDVDLSTGLDAFPKLVKSIKEGYDIAIGSRFVKGAVVERSLKREVLSKGYNLLLKLVLNVNFSDAQCGFKGINRRVVAEVLPKVKDTEWFFDTELLYRAQKGGLKIKEIPVEWVEDKDTKVKVWKTVYDYVKSTLNLRFEFLGK